VLPIQQHGIESYVIGMFCLSRLSTLGSLAHCYRNGTSTKTGNTVMIKGISHVTRQDTALSWMQTRKR